ncbi:molybdopterin oxidoreductase family protein [Methylobacterium radiotolerans]|uniref:molybdopterin oxidoreductase family protein n=1 Tax=Methylobacterium radiotolerans TaxID=31998 RepID=UPI000D5CDB2E|nr:MULTISPECIES: molybdopterin oxidoreductase family protein [Methylobacterium]MDE3747494.1 molybdopterin oxidoreductase family protein [Methylobacterium radiotolerans]PVZ04676.1 anaerobic selenocysteine-containing dehydrogenase [Methylobacterium organophilum]
MVRTVCPHDCPSACSLDVQVADGRVVSVRGGDNPYTAGVICAKVSRYGERVHHPDRILHPLERVGPKGGGAWRRISWDAALDRLAAAFSETADRWGAEAVWPYNSGGTMGLVQRDGIHRLTHVMGYSRRKRTICTAVAIAGWSAGVGRIAGPDPREMALSDLIVVWGGNPVSTQVNAMTHISRARKTRGAKLVVIDPYRTGTAAAADLHLALRPGTDGALACAVLHVLFRDGHADRAYLAAQAEDTAALEAHLASRTPEWAAAITGLEPAAIEAFAALYGRTPRSYIRCGFGFTRSRNGAVNLHAVTCLPTVTGAWQHEGGGALWQHAAIFNWDKTLTEGLDARAPGVRELDMSRIGAVLTDDPDALQGGPPVRAMLIQSANPAVSAPDSARVRAGLTRPDVFVAVHEQFMTETAALADLVLPATTFLEHDDIYGAGGHSHIQAGPAILEPPGECRSNHALLSGLAARLGADHAGFRLTARDLADATLARSGWGGLDRLEAEGWIDAQPDFAESHFLTGFGHPDGRFRFAPDWAALGPRAAGMPALPDHWPEAEPADAEHPFRMIAPPARQFLNATFTNVPESLRREGRPTCLIHPADGVRLGIGTGDAVEVGNARGRVRLHARLAEGQQPGVVVVESLWPSAAFAGGDGGINTLIGSAPAAPNDGAAFHDTAVWVRAA